MATSHVMIHSILVFIFSALGLAMWARMTFTFAPGDQERLHSLWASLSLFGQGWLVFSFVVPAAYYLFTLLSSVSVVPKRALKRSGITMHLIALPVFIALYTKFPTVSRSALLTAFFWFMMYRERVQHDHAAEPCATSNAG